jgi:hypothetical protein
MSLSNKIGFIIKLKAKQAPCLNRASRELVSSSSYFIGLSRSSPRFWGLILGGLEPGRLGGAI